MSTKFFTTFGKGTKFVSPVKSGPKTTELSTQLDRAIAEINKVQTISGVLSIISAMEFAEIRANTEKATDLEKKARAIKLWADDKLGKMLIEMKEKGQLADGKDNLLRGTKLNPGEKVELADLKLSKTQSARAQKLAKLPEKEKAEKIQKEVDKIGTKRKRRKIINSPQMPVYTTGSGKVVETDHVHIFNRCACGASEETV